MSSAVEQLLTTLAAHVQTKPAEFGSLRIRTDDATLRRHSRDKSYHHESQRPRAVVAVASEAHVSLVLSLANALKVPVVAYAAGTSLEAQATLIDHNGIILDCSEMDNVVAVHEQDLDCVVEPGVGWGELREHLKPTGLFFPPDPGAAACIGGMCGTNCSGTLAFRYGTMKDNVLSLRVVLADGTVIKTRNRAVKSSAGYDLTRLFIGSEGTLGIVTQATLRLRRIPTHSSVVIAQFPTLAASAIVVQRLVQSGAPFLRLEIIDDLCIKAVNTEIEDPARKFAELTTIMAECAGGSHDAVLEQLASFKQACGDGVMNLTVATNEEEAEHLWSLRKRAYFSATALRQHEVDKKFTVVVTDVAVPISRLVDILVATKQMIEEAQLVSPIVAHAGDGNFHCLMVVDDNDPAEIERATTVRDKMALLALQMEGTCTGEHGIGIGKIHLLEKELGHGAMQLMRTLKKALDPNNILNPGKVFHLESPSKL